MTTTLITGANKGPGFETARRLVDAGNTVYVASRDSERGTRAAEQLGARAIQLDVPDDAFVDAAVRTVEAAGGLDVLINNAGIADEWGSDNHSCRCSAGTPPRLWSTSAAAWPR